MPKIRLITDVTASVERVFDLARNIDLHKTSMEGTNEEAIAGQTSGLIELGETVTWRARHFGIYQTLEARITEMESPVRFVDEMMRGAFASMHHTHLFETYGAGTRMTNAFVYTSPLGLLSRFADWLFLEKYMTRLLRQRNDMLKHIAENLVVLEK